MKEKTFQLLSQQVFMGCIKFTKNIILLTDPDTLTLIIYVI